jgi:hypothetical protein
MEPRTQINHSNNKLTFDNVNKMAKSLNTELFVRDVGRAQPAIVYELGGFTGVFFTLGDVVTFLNKRGYTPSMF